MIPIYTEISNRERSFLRIKKELSIVLYLHPLAHPVNALNSLYQLLQHREDIELLLIAEEKDAYQYDTLMDRFPVLRVMFPEHTLSFSEILMLGCQESFSKHVLFLDDSVQIETLPLEIFSLYVDDPQYGVIVPQCFSMKNEVIPSQVKPTLKNGFLHTVAWDKHQNAGTVLYPICFCFLLNKEMFLAREMNLGEYSIPLYTRAEFGWRVWKSGYWVIQVRQWKVVLLSEEEVEMTFVDNDEYFFFHCRNTIEKIHVRKQNAVLLSLFLARFFRFQWRKAMMIWNYLCERKKFQAELALFPLEDSMIFSIINKEKA